MTYPTRLVGPSTSTEMETTVGMDITYIHRVGKIWIDIVDKSCCKIMTLLECSL